MATSPVAIDIGSWRDYGDLIVDSLWILGSRAKYGVHTSEYWGNFVPQIPYQAIRRFTRPGEIIIDPFVGLGTTLIEARRLGRHSIGIDLSPSVVDRAREIVATEPNPYMVRTEIFVGDSTSERTTVVTSEILESWGMKSAQLLIMHPPYHDIIVFSDDERDLSRCSTLDQFLYFFENSVSRFSELLDCGRFLVLVIGDKYDRGEWTPLGFETMSRVLKLGFKLKSICVKDIQETRSKRGQKNLWRYRALKNDFYLFRHEYVMFFQKVG